MWSRGTGLESQARPKWSKGTGLESKVGKDPDVEIAKFPPGG